MKNIQAMFNSEKHHAGRILINKFKVKKTPNNLDHWDSSPVRNLAAFIYFRKHINTQIIHCF